QVAQGKEEEEEEIKEKDDVYNLMSETPPVVTPAAPTNNFPQTPYDNMPNIENPTKPLQTAYDSFTNIVTAIPSTYNTAATQFSPTSKPQFQATTSIDSQYTSASTSTAQLSSASSLASKYTPVSQPISTTSNTASNSRAAPPPPVSQNISTSTTTPTYRATPLQLPPVPPRRGR
ncbi:unnamed protein product, partial [Meganyctiphanes norvegica]